MISIALQPDDIIKMRFAYSPLIELSKSYRILKNPARQAKYHKWVEEATKALRGIELPYMDAVILGKVYIADFVTPTPTSTQATIEDELRRVLDTSDEVIRQTMNMVIQYSEPTPARRAFLDDPRAALDCLVQELYLYWKIVLAAKWPRIQAVLEGDVLYQARHYALNGSDALFPNLDAKLRYTEGQLQVLKEKAEYHACADPYGVKNLLQSYQIGLLSYQLKGEGLQLVPSVFDCGVSWQLNPNWQPMIIYGARGTALWQQDEPEAPDESLRLVMGESRARLLQALTQPLNTGELANQLHLTAGAVSQHLNKLNEAGLVEPHRSGNRVYYRLTHRGERLLDVFL